MLSFVFVKQKTAYEMRMSDWSSDVCSSDLTAGLVTRWDIGELGPIDRPSSTLVLGYSEMGVDASPDLDNSPANIATLRTIWNHQQHSAEWRFSGDFDNGLFGLGDGLNLLLGVFYMNTHFRQRSEEHTSELQSLMRISYAVFCLKKKL